MESHGSTSYSSSSLSPTVSETKIREQEDRTESDISPVTVSTTVDERSVRSDIDQANKNPKPNQKRTKERTERHVHASSSHEVSLEPIFKRREDLGRHSVYTHFPKDRNCEICQRTKITRAPCRRRNGGAVLSAENFGDLITADHKVLSDNCESRNNHRYAVVVQDLATR